MDSFHNIAIRIVDACYRRLGDEAVYKPVLGSAVIVSAIKQQEINYFPGGMESFVPEDEIEIFVRQSEIANPDRNDQITLNNAIYEVVRRENKDGIEWRLIVKEIEAAEEFNYLITGDGDYLVTGDGDQLIGA